MIKLFFVCAKILSLSRINCIPRLHKFHTHIVYSLCYQSCLIKDDGDDDKDDVAKGQNRFDLQKLLRCYSLWLNIF